MINDLWYKNAVIYCLSVGAYMDANGDGTGDFQGLMRRFSRHLDAGVVATARPLARRKRKHSRQKDWIAKTFCRPRFLPVALCSNLALVFWDNATRSD
jgi:hypothetical protein